MKDVTYLTIDTYNNFIIISMHKWSYSSIYYLTTPSYFYLSINVLMSPVVCEAFRDYYIFC